MQELAKRELLEQLELDNLSVEALQNKQTYQELTERALMDLRLDLNRLIFLAEEEPARFLLEIGLTEGE